MIIEGLCFLCFNSRSLHFLYVFKLTATSLCFCLCPCCLFFWNTFMALHFIISCYSWAYHDGHCYIKYRKISNIHGSPLYGLHFTGYLLDKKKKSAQTCWVLCLCWIFYETLLNITHYTTLGLFMGLPKVWSVCHCLVRFWRWCWWWFVGNCWI